MPCGTLTDIALDCTAEVGGIAKIYVKEVGAGVAIDTSAASGGSIAYTGITVGNTALSAIATDFTELELSKEVGSITDTVTNAPEAGTTFYTCVATATFNGSTAARLQTLHALAKSTRLLCLVLDNEDRYWLVGNDKGCVLTTGSNQSGTAYSDLNGVSIELTGVSGEPRLLVSSVV